MLAVHLVCGSTAAESAPVVNRASRKVCLVAANSVGILRHLGEQGYEATLTGGEGGVDVRVTEQGHTVRSNVAICGIVICCH